MRSCASIAGLRAHERSQLRGYLFDIVGHRRAISLSRLALHPGLRRRWMQTRLGAWPRFDALEPRVQVLQRRIERLLDAATEIERAIQNDVGDGEAIARDVLLTLEQLVEPLELVLHDRLHPRRRLGQDAHP